MKLKDCRIGTEFQTAEGRRWRVTDVGRRTLAAIVIELPEGTPPRGCEDPAWLQGPPYVVEEVLFDEKDIDAAFLSVDAAIRESRDDRHHPGFPHEVVGTMMKAHLATFGRKAAYPFPRLLRLDRWDASTLEVLHPYATQRTADGWAVKVFRLFEQTFDQLPDQDFVALPLARPADLATAHKARKARPASSPSPARARPAPVRRSLDDREDPA